MAGLGRETARGRTVMGHAGDGGQASDQASERATGRHRPHSLGQIPGRTPWNGVSQVSSHERAWSAPAWRWPQTEPLALSQSGLAFRRVFRTRVGARRSRPERLGAEEFLEAGRQRLGPTRAGSPQAAARSRKTGATGVDPRTTPHRDSRVPRARVCWSPSVTRLAAENRPCRVGDTRRFPGGTRTVRSVLCDRCVEP